MTQLINMVITKTGQIKPKYGLLKKLTTWATCTIAIHLVLFSFISDAQTIHPDILQKKWKALWIAVPGEPEHDYGVYKFRNVIDLAVKPDSFIVHVSADNRYKLFVNDSLVSHGPARGELFHYNFETIDLAPYLKAGKNIVAALVWNFGNHRAEAQISFRTAFILQGNSTQEEILNTSKKWKCIRDTSYAPLKPDLIHTFYVSGPGEQIDFNQAIAGWTSAAYVDTGWKNASEIFAGLPKGVFEWTNGWMLVPRPIPQMELTPQRLTSTRSANGIVVPKNFPSDKTSFTIPSNKKITLLLDQGFLTNAYPVLQFSNGRNSEINLRYTEALYKIENTSDWRAEKQKGNRNEIEGKRFVGVRDQLISNGSVNQSFTTLAWRTFRYVEIQIETKEDPLTINDFYGVFTGYPFKMEATFDAKNPELAKMMDVGWRTARLCAVETYMDCPYYEQLQYIGDTRIQALVSLFNSGDNLLVRHAINQLDYSRMAEGITLSRYPSIHAQEIPTFSLFWIGMLHDYWMYQPDSNFVKGKLPGSRQVLNFFQRYQQSDGSLKDAPYWEFTDWAEAKGWYRGTAPVGKNGYSAALDLQLCWAFQLVAAMEEALGMQEYARQYKDAAALLKQTILKKYWSPSKQLFADTPEQDLFSQHTNTLAILTGVITGGEASALMQKILTDRSLTQATIYFKYYVHQAVAKVGLGNRYLDLLRDWRDQLANGLTTWAEISDHNNSRSDCHAWGASPNVEFFRIVLGIDSDAPGFRKIKIKPHLGSLTQAMGKMPHPNGDIAVRYLQIKGKWKAEITLPNKTTGTFYWNEKSYPLIAGKNTLNL
jgi:hypothetical protein